MHQVVKAKHSACYEHHTSSSSSLHSRLSAACCFPLKSEGLPCRLPVSTAWHQQFRFCPKELTEGHAVGWQQSPEEHPDFASHGPALEKHKYPPHPLKNTFILPIQWWGITPLLIHQKGFNHPHEKKPRRWARVQLWANKASASTRRAALWACGSSPRAARTSQCELKETSSEQNMPCYGEPPND